MSPNFVRGILSRMLEGKEEFRRIIPNVGRNGGELKALPLAHLRGENSQVFGVQTCVDDLMIVQTLQKPCSVFGGLGSHSPRQRRKINASGVKKI